ncbi:MAG: HAD family hydrolase [Acidimicrobiales bacterium]
MTSPGIDGVLFDFGRTLFGHAPEAELLVREAAALGVKLTERDGEALWAEIDVAAMDAAEVALGRDLDAAVWAERWLALYGLADRIVPGVGSALAKTMEDPATWVPYASTALLLRRLHAAGRRVGVLSNTGWNVRRPFVARGLGGYVDEWVLSCEVGLVKPDPAVFAIACERLGTAPERTLMVGDNALADGGASAVGLPVLILPAGAAVGEENGLDLVPALAGI